MNQQDELQINGIKIIKRADEYVLKMSGGYEIGLQAISVFEE